MFIAATWNDACYDGRSVFLSTDTDTIKVQAHLDLKIIQGTQTCRSNEGQFMI